MFDNNNDTGLISFSNDKLLKLIQVKPNAWNVLSGTYSRLFSPDSSGRNHSKVVEALLQIISDHFLCMKSVAVLQNDQGVRSSVSFVLYMAVRTFLAIIDGVNTIEGHLGGGGGGIDGGDNGKDDGSLRGESEGEREKKGRGK